MSHALHKLHMHVEWGIRALIVYLDSNCDNVCMLGELLVVRKLTTRAMRWIKEFEIP